MITELPFDRAEYDGRIDRVRARMRGEGLDAVLLFHQESLFYLFGYDQIGYWVYQTVVLPADGRPPVAICRAPDALMIGDSPFIPDVRTWLDDADRDPAAVTMDVLRELGLLSGTRVGVEMTSHALLARYADLLRRHCPPGVALTDASELVTEERLRKSPAEIAYMRRAAEIMDLSFEAALRALEPGVRECDLHAAIAGAMYGAGGDAPAVAPPIASGPRTLTQTHGAATERVIAAGDPVTIEVGAPYRRYHAVGLRTAWVGAAPDEAMRIHEALRAGLDSGLDCVRPGARTADVARTVLAAFEERGLSRRGRHVGYGIGIGYPPTWLDNLRIKETDPHILEPGMTFFLFAGALNRSADVYIALGDPVLVTPDGGERLGATPRRLLVR